MKKSSNVLLSAFFIASVASCRSDKEWVDGADTYGIGDVTEYRVQDTVYNNTPYRYYRGRWYPIYNNRICVDRSVLHHKPPVHGVTVDRSIASHTVTYSRGARRSGGFGSIALNGTAHS